MRESSPRWRNYEFDLAGYKQAVETQQDLLVEATEASKRLDRANEIVREFEEKLRGAMENAMGEVRLHAKEAAGTNGR